MTEPNMTLHESLRKIGANLEGDFLRVGLALLVQIALDLEVTQQLGAAKHQRTAERTNPRNGTRERPWATRVGRIELQIPKLRHGSYTAHGHGLRFSVIPACFWRESSNFAGMKSETWTPDNSTLCGA